MLFKVSQSSTTRGTALVLLLSAPFALAQSVSENPPVPNKQKPAAALIAKQSLPKVIPRVLQRATPENTRVIVSLNKQRLWLLVGDEVAIDSPVSTGKRSRMTPTGEFTVLDRYQEHSSSTYGSFVDKKGRVIRAGVSSQIDSAPSGTSFRGLPMKYFMRITPEGIGIHAGELPGYPASHGGIRLPEEIARLVYENTRVGTSVTIVE
jgi:lipoprotein-anchoring transpeptidase ErfK/SrfK